MVSMRVDSIFEFMLAYVKEKAINYMATKITDLFPYPCQRVHQDPLETAKVKDAVCCRE